MRKTSVLCTQKNELYLLRTGVCVKALHFLTAPGQNRMSKQQPAHTNSVYIAHTHAHRHTETNKITEQQM